MLRLRSARRWARAVRPDRPCAPLRVAWSALGHRPPAKPELIDLDVKPADAPRSLYGVHGESSRARQAQILVNSARCLMDTFDQKPARRGRPFEKGNPGRSRGARNKTTVALEQLLEGQAEAIVAKVIEKALDGDRMAMRLVFERLMGSRRERSVTNLDLPQIRSAADCAEASATILAAVSSGKIAPGEGLALRTRPGTIESVWREYSGGGDSRGNRERITCLGD